MVAATSEPGRVVTNGMSQYSRNERNANAGIVVGITPDGLSRAARSPASRCSAHWEARAFELGGGNYDAPGAAGRRLPRAAAPSTRFGEVHAVVQARRAPGRSRAAPAGLRDRRDPRSAARVRQADQGLRHARRGADRRRDAHLLADPHHARRRLARASTRAACIPAGEGAGYAGGILSAGVDGIKVAEAVALSLVEERKP